jgi:hypothetical protein
MKVRNIVIALLLSMTLTFGLAFIYVFYPIISLVLRSMFRNPGNAETSGVVVVAGGVSDSFLIVSVVLGVFLFLMIFAWLQRRREL